MVNHPTCREAGPQLAVTASACPPEPQPAPRPGRLGEPERRPGARTAPRAEFWRPTGGPARRPGGTAEGRSPKIRPQGRAGRRRSRTRRTPGPAGPSRFPTSRARGLRASALSNAWRKGRAARPRRRVCAGRRGSQGMGRGRDAGRRVPGPQGPTTFRALRLAARVRRACAPTRRDVTTTASPHVGLFGSRQAPPLHSGGSAWLEALPPGSESA